MALAQETLPPQVTVAPAVSSLDAEVEDYRRFTDALRTVRRLFARNEYTDVEQACETLIGLADNLEKRAIARTRRDALAQAAGLQGGEGTAHELPGRYSDATLYEAQMEARIELMATVQVLADLNSHTRTMVSALRGNVPVTYTRQGKRSAYGV